MKTPRLLPLLPALWLSLSLNAQDKPSFEIDLGAKAKGNGMAVKAVLFGKKGATKTEGSGLSGRTTLAVDLHPAPVAGDDLLILHLIQETGKGANIGNDKTCRLMDGGNGVFPLVAYGFDAEGGISFSAVTEGQIGLLLAPTPQQRALYLAFKRPAVAGKLRSVGIGDEAAMPSSKKSRK
ncbi:MAG: hypothetical protein ACO1TE_08480 [Prosthecobacter sp.]